MTDMDVYDDTVSDEEEDQLLDGDEDLGSLELYQDTRYNLEVVECTKKTLPLKEDEELPQRVINVTLAVTDGEFEGERTWHSFWIGPKGLARLPQHKRARKAFNKFYQACTGETIGKHSQANPADCVGANISAMYVSAEYTDKEGNLKNEGQSKWDDFSWDVPQEIESYDED